MFGSLLTTSVAILFAVQAPSPPAAAPQKDQKPAVTLTGCVARDVSKGASYTFSDAKTGVKYQLSGIDKEKSANQPRELVIGTGRWRVTIVGGLVPSPNVAAQAGAIDPAQAAIANMTRGPNRGTGNVELPQFLVTSVQWLDGRC